MPLDWLIEAPGGHAGLASVALSMPFRCTANRVRFWLETANPPTRGPVLA
jgi:hypothetical protein